MRLCYATSIQERAISVNNPPMTQQHLAIRKGVGKVFASAVTSVHVTVLPENITSGVILKTHLVKFGLGM